jgi:Domain of unknown function (DUF4403)
LKVHPQEVGIFPFVATPATISAGLQVVARPEVILASSSPPADNMPLPQPTTTPSSNAFFISFHVEADYAFINSQLRKAFKLDSGEVRYSPTGNDYLTVTGASVYAYGQRAVLRIDAFVSGFFGSKVTIYLELRCSVSV